MALFYDLSVSFGRVGVDDNKWTAGALCLDTTPTSPFGIVTPRNILRTYAAKLGDQVSAFANQRIGF